jgi:REP element-mobilizing transposase RayT
MARQGRLHVPHGTYYVIDQFSRDRDILVANPARQHSATELQQIEANRTEYERLLAQAASRSRARIHAHCWLPDCAHFLIQIRIVPLQSIMQTLRGSISHFLKKHTDVQEPVHPRRYRATLVDPEDDFFFDVCRTIFTAPIRARLCRRLQDYGYSSIRMFVGGPIPDFLAESSLATELSIRGIDTPAQIARFFALSPTPGFRIRLARGRTLAGPLFLRQLRRDMNTARITSIDLIVAWASARFDLQPGKLLSESATTEVADAQTLVAWLITATGTASLARSARLLRCSKSTVHRRIARLLNSRPDLATAAALEDCIKYLQSAEQGNAKQMNLSE